MSSQRRPAAFHVTPPEVETPPADEPVRPRRPHAVRADEPTVKAAEVDVFGEPDAVLDDPPPALPPRRRSWALTIFLAAMGTLFTMGIGVLADRLIRSLFYRADWLGWIALVLALLAAAALLVIVLRELRGLVRLASVERLQAQAGAALLANDAKEARKVVAALTGLFDSRPETAAGRRALAEVEGEIIDGADLVRLAETEMLGPLDARARKLVLDAAKRVSVVTAVSPRALVDVGYVAFESVRLIRRMAELYGGRPGMLGLMRLTRGVLAHLAVTSTIAVGDGIIQQTIGHGLASRLSARLGEGVVNGMMTARIGIAAMETARPLPFSALKRPGMSDFLAALAKFDGKQAEPQAGARK